MYVGASKWQEGRKQGLVCMHVCTYVKGRSVAWTFERLVKRCVRMHMCMYICMYISVEGVRKWQRKGGVYFRRHLHTYLHIYKHRYICTY